MKFKMTFPSAILGLILFIVVALQSFGRYNSGKWSGTAGIVFALAGAAIGLALALAVTATLAGDPAKSSTVEGDIPTPTASKPSRQFRNSILLWLAVVVIFLLMYRLLDALHINWRQYLN